MTLISIVVVTLLLVLVLFALRQRSTGPGHVHPQKSRRRRPRAARGPERSRAAEFSGDTYHALSVDGSCQSARKLAGHRFLVREAPSLPLRDCDFPSCKCKLVHHDDRRRENYDRRDRQSIRSEFYVSEGHHERRVSRGRRAVDFAFDAFRDSSGVAEGS